MHVPKRLCVTVRGQVQGVGFRPHVFQTATRLNLTGHVKNDSNGVCIEVQGAQVALFLPELLGKLPSLARVDQIKEKWISWLEGEETFQITVSQASIANTMIAPDIGICAECLYELFDPSCRYFLYPFLNCTQCGPRFTITRHLPYDRHQTSMDEFPLCHACFSDYTNPLNRRYHAQPTACHACGPHWPRQLKSIEEMARRILQGEIIAVKGIGGYQLICDASNRESIEQLRLKKARRTKPFAMMVLNVKSARAIAKVCLHTETLLNAKARPIVILPKLNESLHDEIAPGLNQYGLMLPYTPFHYLLFYVLAGQPQSHEWLESVHPIRLVVTSANLGGEPLIRDDEVALHALPRVAEQVFVYNRQIICRADDSVVRLVNDAPLWIRRARGVVPQRIQLPHRIPCTLALGAHLKNTFCITRDDEAFLSQHIGSLNNRATIDFYHESLSHFISFLEVRPECIVHDLHPDFYTTHLAQILAETYDVPCVGVQHHHAHLASVLAEHGVTTPTLGLALDGYGYGSGGLGRRTVPSGRSYV